MKIETLAYLTTGDVRRTKKKEGKDRSRSWRVSVDKFWGESDSGTVYFVPDYDLGYISAIRAADWPGSAQAQALADLDADIGDSDDQHEKRRLRRLRAAFVFDGVLSQGRISVPRELVWILERENKHRDLIILSVGHVVEIWPVQQWQHYIAGPSGKEGD